MSFEIDNQTLDDLNIFPKTKKDNSVFDIFKFTETTGGQNSLINMMKEPSDDFELLLSRTEAIQFIINNQISFEFTDKTLDFIEHYLNLNVIPLRDKWIFVIGDFLDYMIKPTNEYYSIEKGLNYLKFFLIKFKKFVANLVELNAPIYFQNIINQAENIYSSDIFKHLIGIPIDDIANPFTRKGLFKRLSYWKRKARWIISINHFDNIIRSDKKDELVSLLEQVFQIDALITVAKAGKENNFCIPTYHNNGDSLINIENSFHPFVNNPVANSIALDKPVNMCFLTGANMAGKSTFLKSVGLCCYLAHLGFPVPAKKMETSLFSGLITTINLSDNVSIGYSHFYSEVKRVKNTALKIQEKRKILVIFDELFRGTNVKDAYDASLMIISAFANINQCAFFISTHIVEIADELKKKESIVFKYFESDLVNDTPVYSYKLMDGISTERHGLRIVKNEKIIEILEQIVADNNMM